MSLFCWLRRFFLFYKKKRFIVLCCKPFLWKTYGMRNTYLLHTLAYINVGFKKSPLAIFFPKRIHEYFSLPNKRVDRITVLPRAIFKKLNCPRLNNCLSYDTFNFLKRGVIKLSSWTINKYEM